LEERQAFHQVGCIHYYLIKKWLNLKRLLLFKSLTPEMLQNWHFLKKAKYLVLKTERFDQHLPTNPRVALIPDLAKNLLLG